MMLANATTEARPSVQGGWIVRAVDSIGNTICAIRCFSEAEVVSMLKHLYLLGARQ